MGGHREGISICTLSRMSARLVDATTIRPELGVKPSIYIAMWWSRLVRICAPSPLHKDTNRTYMHAVIHTKFYQKYMHHHSTIHVSHHPSIIFHNILCTNTSTRSWLRVFSLSLFPRLPRAERARPMASISSINKIHGACSLPFSKRSRTRAGPTPRKER